MIITHLALGSNVMEHRYQVRYYTHTIQYVLRATRRKILLLLRFRTSQIAVDNRRNAPKLQSWPIKSTEAIHRYRDREAVDDGIEEGLLVITTIGTVRPRGTDNSICLSFNEAEHPVIVFLSKSSKCPSNHA